MSEDDNSEVRPALDDTAPGGTAAGLDAPPGRHERPSHHRVSSALIGALLALLGFALAIQLRSSSGDQSFAGARQEDLVRILDDQNSQQDRLRQQIAALQSAQSRLDNGGDASAAASEASERANALGVLTGTVAATGPGITATLSDPLSGLHAEDLLDVVAELRGAGAEAIQIDSVRIGLSSSFSDASDGSVTADGVRLERPYTVLAIGNAETLDTALTIPGGVAATAKAAGGALSITRSASIDIKATRATPTPQYATPVGS
jgi:uncharacterized protein YlxW (UPF0749 family)